MLKIAATLLMGYFALTSTAYSAWYYHTEESTFGSDTHVLITEKGPYFFGLRCEDSEVLFIFSTPDRSFNEDTLKMANALGPVLLFKVDSEEVINLTAQIRDNEGKALVSGKAAEEILDSIENATSKVSVALQLLGDVYHETQFGVAGSTAKAKQFRSSCPAFAE